MQEKSESTPFAWARAGLDLNFNGKPCNAPVVSKFEFPIKPIAVVAGRPPDSAKLMRHLLHEDKPELLQSEHLWQRRAGRSATWIDESRSCRLHAIGRGDGAMGGGPARPAPNTRPTRNAKLCAGDRSPVTASWAGRKSHCSDHEYGKCRCSRVRSASTLCAP